ncbi:hypothetical protein [Corynebacterium sp. CNJ-954]|uniref:hypothetical protein n=1 Tax=Corynebacterium sp. CNJ-954 TaxID=1904962 RepID=UPI0011154194|nr:hypothetical protein [Corynebacterium sp. CNJ-954]
MKSATDHPAGSSYVGRHRSERPGPEPTPLELMEREPWFRRLQDVYMVLGAVTVLLLVALVFRVLFLVVMSLW